MLRPDAAPIGGSPTRTTDAAAQASASSFLTWNASLLMPQNRPSILDEGWCLQVQLCLWAEREYHP
jgi:hypothetical protein